MALTLGLGLVVACLVVAGLLRARWAYALGWVIQVAAVALGFWVPRCSSSAPSSRSLWGTAYFLGRKIERERPRRTPPRGARLTADTGRTQLGSAA